MPHFHGFGGLACFEAGIPGFDQFAGGAILHEGAALARVFLKDPVVVVLDEATSSLDNESERLVEEAMEELLRGRTTLIIAHRLRTVRRADRVLVLEHGRIVEEGTHDKLASGSGVYGKLYRAELRD